MSKNSNEIGCSQTYPHYPQVTELIKSCYKKFT